MSVGIIGGGIAGLVAAYELAKAGQKVALFERAAKLGGLAASFAIEEGHQLEKYYHSLCKPDRPFLRIVRELGIHNCLRWATTDMGLFYNGGLHTLGDPISLLAFPHLSFRDKARFAQAILKVKLRDSVGWQDLEGLPAREWLVGEYGQRTYDMLYKTLLDLKFRDHAPRISAAWMWARFHRLGKSRTIAQKEHLGYLEGGSQLYIEALEKAVRTMGGEIHLEAPVEEVVIDEGRVVGIRYEGQFLPCAQVLSTVPIPIVRSLLPPLDGAYFDNLRSLEYIDVLVMVLRLSQRFSKYFWMNVSDPRMDIAGLIEYTNLNPCAYLGGDAILYIPQYLTADHSLYQMPEEQLFDLYCGYLSLIRPDFRKGWVKGYWVFRDRFAQPICEVGFSTRMPGVQTPLPNLYLTDSYQLHPDDRTISSSTDLGIKAAHLILQSPGLGRQ